MAAIDISNYTLSDFSPNVALTGGLVLARSGSVGSYIYYFVSEFKINNTQFYPTFKYCGIIEDTLIFFNDSGISVDSVYTLKLASANITGGNSIGDTFSKLNPITGDLDYYTLKTLNYRENIAKEVLGFLINSVKDPDALTDEKIKYLISASFKFSFEFVNQAINLRNTNEEIEEQEEEAVENPSAAMNEQTFWNLLLNAFSDLKNVINKMYSSETPIYTVGSGGGGSTQVTLTDYVESYRGEEGSATFIGKNDPGVSTDSPTWKLRIMWYHPDLQIYDYTNVAWDNRYDYPQ